MNEKQEWSLLDGQLHFVQLFLRLLRGFQVFLRGCKGCVTQPRLDGSDVDPCPQPARCGSVPKFVQVPFFLIQSSLLRDLLATVVQIAVIEVTLRGRKNQRAVRDARVLAGDIGDFLRERNRAFFPVLRKKVILRLGSHVNPSAGKIQVGPVECLEFASPKTSSEG